MYNFFNHRLCPGTQPSVPTDHVIDNFILASESRSKVITENVASRKELVQIHGRLTKCLAILLNKSIRAIAVTGDGSLRNITNEFLHTNMKLRKADLDKVAIENIRAILSEGAKVLDPRTGSLSEDDIEKVMEELYDIHGISVEDPEAQSYKEASADVWERIRPYVNQIKDRRVARILDSAIDDESHIVFKNYVNLTSVFGISDT